MVDVTVIGGGLAGMTAALRLLQCGCHVTLYEADTRLGGKAGAARTEHGYVDHGYHIFPLWYRNAWKLIDELGIRGNFVDRNDFNMLFAGEFPHFRILRDLPSPLYVLQNMFSGYMSPAEMFLLYYSLLDLMSRDYSYRGYLDQISLIGFLRSNFYRTETVAAHAQELVLKGISAPAYFASAMTIRKVMLLWMKYPRPMFRIARGNLQQFWIEPIQRELEHLNCVIYMNRYLENIKVENSRVSFLHFRDQNEKRYSVEVNKERVLLAIPPEQVNKIVDDEVYVAAPALANIRYLQSQQMAALTLVLNRRIAGIPKNHVFLAGSQFGLSFIDISQIWQGYETTVLDVIASDLTQLEGLSDDYAQEQILKEIRRFLPAIVPAVIKNTFFQSHRSQPLFMNDVGAWPFRPDPGKATELTNLYLAGDYCRSFVDLTCMEGAITTGLHAAESIRKDAGLHGCPIEIIRPDIPAKWLRDALACVLLPAAALAKGITLITEPGVNIDKETGHTLVGIRQATKYGRMRNTLE